LARSANSLSNPQARFVGYVFSSEPASLKRRLTQTVFVLKTRRCYRSEHDGQRLTGGAIIAEGYLQVSLYGVMAKRGTLDLIL